MPPITAPSAAVSQSCKSRSGISLHLARFEASHVEESRDTSSWPAQIALWNKCAACSSSSVTPLIRQVLSDGAPGTKLKGCKFGGEGAKPCQDVMAWASGMGAGFCRGPKQQSDSRFNTPWASHNFLSRCRYPTDQL